MSISDFVCYVLRVPANLDGYAYTCKALKYLVEHDGSPRFYEHLQAEYGKSFSCIEKSLRLAKTKAIQNMSSEDYGNIFGNHSDRVTVKEFICYAAQYYRKEFINEG